MQQEDTKHKQKNAYTQVLKYTGAFGVVQVINILIGMVRNKCVAVWLGPIGMGLIDIFTKTSEFVGSATNFGLSVSAVKQFAELHAAGRSEELSHSVMLTRTWGIVGALFGLGLGVAASPLISRFTFGDYSYTLHFALAALMVPCITITGIELAVLKGMRRLKRIALYAMCTALAALIITAPMVIFVGNRGIVPALVLCTLSAMLLYLYATHDIMPWRTRLSLCILREGKSLLSIGIAFNAAAVILTGGEMLIRSFMINVGSVGDVGLYAAGYLIIVAYARLVFVAADADYYPRLSAVHNDVLLTNETVNRQIEVYVLIIGPFLSCFMLLLPHVVPILYDSKYLTAVPMITAGGFHMLFKSVSTPIGYIVLAKAEARTFLVMELLSVGIFVGLVIGLFSAFGLLGAGIALSLSTLADALMWGLVYWHKYGYVMHRGTIIKVVVQASAVAFIIALCFAEGIDYCLWRYVIGLPIVAVSAWYSYHHISCDVEWQRLLTDRFRLSRRAPAKSQPGSAGDRESV